MPKLKKYKQSGYRSYTLNLGFCYIGKQLEPLTHYQIGCEDRLNLLKPIYFNFKRKPWIKDLYALNALFAIPFILYVIINIMMAFVVLFLVGLYYITLAPYLVLWADRNYRHLIIPFMALQVIATSLMYLVLR